MHSEAQIPVSPSAPKRNRGMPPQNIEASSQDAFLNFVRINELVAFVNFLPNPSWHEKDLCRLSKLLGDIITGRGTHKAWSTCLGRFARINDRKDGWIIGKGILMSNRVLGKISIGVPKVVKLRFYPKKNGAFQIKKKSDQVDQERRFADTRCVSESLDIPILLQP